MPTLTKTTVDGQELIGHLYSESWFGDNTPKEIYIRYYSMPFTPKDDFYLPGLEGDVLKYADTEFKIIVSHISDQQYLSHIPWITQSEGVNNKITIEKLERKLPETDYVLVTTPILYGTGDHAYQDSSLKMDAFVGMLRVIGGNNLLRQLVREGTVNVLTGNMNTLTSIVPVPSVCEGPFATLNTWQELKEIMDALVADSNSLHKTRIWLSTQLIERAFLAQDGLKFFSYWVAIEVAADTHNSGKIITLLAKAYKKPNGYVQNFLGFDLIKGTRTAVFHGGEHYEIPSDVERYMQCLFLDVVRAKIGLKCRGYMATAVKDGFDVRRLNGVLVQAKYLTIKDH